MGPLQADLPVEEGAHILRYALEEGINFIDTAELYETYPHIRRVSELTPNPFIVSTKSFAHTRDQAKQSLEQARKGMNRDVIDIFLLHEQESEHTLRGHRQALDYYLEQREKRVIQAVGISTHTVAGVWAAGEMEEIDVIHPILNIRGVGIQDGTAEEMSQAIASAHRKGKGIYSMKPLGGGSLLREYAQCMEYIRGNPHIHSVAVGIRSIEEARMNILVFSGKEAEKELMEKIALQQRQLHIESWCSQCGECVRRCRQKALENKHGRIVSEQNKCILCGYCISVCPQFAIRIF